MSKPGNAGASPGGLAGWLLARWRTRIRAERRLVLLERISLGPRQTLSLVEAEGRTILVANSADGAAFYPLEETGSRRNSGGLRDGVRGRVSW